MFSVNVKRLRPRLATVRGHENTALFVGTERMAQRADVNDVGVLRMNSNRRDPLAFSSPMCCQFLPPSVDL